ncbi:MAG: MBG domain-containing protein, partial [Bacteroidota bacterium]
NFSPVEEAVVNITGFGSASTDAEGNASFILPDGDYSYTIAASNYLTYPESSFSVTGENLILPAVNLIGNFPFTFNVEDQNNTNLPMAQIVISGTSETYSGPELFESTISTNSLGNAVINLPEGVYDYSVTKADHYPSEGSIVSTLEPGSEPVVLQSYPLITFRVEDSSSLPIEGAKLTLSTGTVLTTAADGTVTKRLPIGEYSLSAYKIGYLANDVAFNITDNNDILLPTLVLQDAEPMLEFTTDISNGLEFRKTLVTKTSPVLNLTFRNIGQGTITINPSDISLSGTDAAEFAFAPVADPIILATGDSYTLDLTFAPLTSGNKTANLTIEDNTPAKILHTIGLSGIAYDSVTIPFFDDFENGNFNNWVVVNDNQPNQWHIGNAANDPGNLSAMISNDGGTNNTYQTGGSGATSIVHFYMDFEIPLAEEGQLFLTFDWKGLGEANLDMMRVYIISPDILPLPGSTITGSIGTNFYLQSEWQSFIYPIPSTHFGQTRRIVFSWINNATGGLQPPIAIDNIYIGNLFTLTTDVNPVGTGTTTGDGTYGAGMPVALEAIPSQGYVFSHWSATNGDFADANEPATIFTMPAVDVSVTANFIVPEPEVTDVMVTYDGTEHTLADGVSPGVEVTWYDAEVGGNIIEAPTATNAGSYTAWAAVVIGENESTRRQATLTINPREITVVADNQTKIYGDSDPELTYEITTGQLVDGESFSGELARTAGEDVGIYAISQGTLALTENYILTFTGAELEISPRPIAVTADELTKIYGNPDPELTFSITDGSLAFDDTFSGMLVREQGEDVGTYAITQGTLALSDNYLMNFTGASLVITQRFITISVDNKTKIYGEADPEFTYIIIDGALAFDDELTGTLEREPGEDAGNYTILQGTLDAGPNYFLTYEAGTLTIIPRAISIAADPQTKIYGEDDPVFTYQVTQGELVFDDVFTGELTRQPGEDVGSYEILQGTLTISDNYEINYLSEQLVITQREITVIADDQTKVYGDIDPELTWQVTTGELAFDDVLTGALTRESGETVGTYSIEQGTLSAGNNYILTFVGGQLLITTKELTIGGSFTVTDKEYDGTTDATITASDLTLQGVVNDDDVQLVDVVAAFETPEPGENILVTIVSAALNGIDTTNYTLTLEGAPTTTANIFQPTYLLSVDIVPAEGGTVTGSGSYTAGETVTLSATASTNYVFLRWEDADGNILGEDSTLDFVMPAEDVILTAHFELENSIAEEDIENIRLYPNPASDYVNISADRSIRQIIITDLNGKEVYSATVHQNDTRISISHLPAGIYLVRIFTSNGTRVTKLQLQ